MTFWGGATFSEGRARGLVVVGGGWDDWPCAGLLLLLLTDRRRDFIALSRHCTVLKPGYCEQVRARMKWFVVFTSRKEWRKVGAGGGGDWEMLMQGPAGGTPGGRFQ